MHCSGLPRLLETPAVFVVEISMTRMFNSAKLQYRAYYSERLRLQQGPGKMLLESWKVLKKFWNFL